MEISARSLLTHELLTSVRLSASATIEELRRLLCAKLRMRQENIELFAETGEELRYLAPEVLVSLRPPTEDELLLFLREKVISSRFKTPLSKTLESALDVQHVAYLLEFVDPNKRDGQWLPYPWLSGPQEEKSCFGCTALHYAALAGFPRCAELILQHPEFSSLTAKCRMSSFLWPSLDYSAGKAEDVEALHCVAVARGRGPELLRLLLACPQIDPNAKAKDYVFRGHPTHSTILTLAARDARKDLLEVLLHDPRVDANARNSTGHKVLTQLCQACRYEWDEGDSSAFLICAQLVLASGCCDDPNGRSMFVELIGEPDGVAAVLDWEAPVKVQVAMDRWRNQRCRRRERCQCTVTKTQRRSAGHQPGPQSSLRRTLRKDSRVHMRQSWVLDADDVWASGELARESSEYLHHSVSV
eukprot:TRINITY_DN43171_c0_g1_i1.p1 TRINITY_DN43171_c0_g1~~TRINITY_DN43171_c0_g1_i1.p1  ORF type:complete len:415 (-),score=46.35 TRINITY_DN43171_c0_g1_i1:224-1468(-)